MALDISFSASDPKTQEFIDLFEFPKESAITIKAPCYEAWEITNEDIVTKWIVTIPTTVYNYVRNMESQTFTANNGTMIRCRPSCSNQASSDILWLSSDAHGNPKDIVRYSDWQNENVSKYKAAFQQLNEQFPGEDKIVYPEEVSTFKVLNVKLIDNVDLEIEFVDETIVNLKLGFVNRFKKKISVAADKTEFIVSLITPACISKLLTQKKIWTSIVAKHVKK